MSDTYGPLALTANAITSVGISAQCTRAYIGNDSPFDVLVSFAVSKPPAVASSNGDWPWVIQAMHHGTLPLPLSSTPMGGLFEGKVWLLPIPRNINQALNGTISALANAWVIGLSDDDPSPDVYAAPRQVDISSQSRHIGVPPGTPFNDVEALTKAVGTAFTVGPVLSLPAGIPTGNIIWFYLHYLYAFPFSATTWWQSYTLRAALFNGSGTAVASTIICQFAVFGIIPSAASADAVAPAIIQPYAPMMAFCAMVATAVSVGFQMTLSSSMGSGTGGILFNMGGSVDLNNINAPGPSSQGTPVPGIGSPLSAVYGTNTSGTTGIF